MQHIIIKNNGPVKNFEMDIKKYNILIGEQATGKSTIAKSIYYSRYIKILISNFLIQTMENGTYYGETVEKSKPFYKYISHNLKNTFIQLFGYSWELDPNFKIRYYFTEEIWIESILANRSRGKKYITESYSPKLRNQLKVLQEEVILMFEESNRIQLSLELGRETKLRNREYILHKINEIFEDELTTYYIPAGRSMLTLLSASRATMNSLQNIDFIMNRFLELIDGVRSVFQDGIAKAFQYFPRGDRAFDVHDMSSHIIKMQKGEYRNDRSGEVLRVCCGENAYEDIQINFASSGQQEIMWLLNFLYVLMLRGEKAFVIIEEPEAHIYPSLQKEIVDFIIQFANICNGNAFITTHSPYVLMTMNNAYYAGCVAGKNRQTEVSKIIKPVYRIEKGKLNAIKLNNNSDEYVVDIIDDNDEISSYFIDDISDKINEVYTSLFMIDEKGSDG
jgi:AAA15 family ATPase/GTPase